ncbi:DUF4241 domain-containing protein [Chitinophaga cymbidii]|uniref:DUF4241 domain-containing protein n=1 Tax=Chitinophaga cymbidii TaxID=1096750 RepID=A0A512RHD5_9BACT|nr:DUF4241 domain-containing protein [Chitinophaga cymbidii]GEP95112.1 hypothetical protein CCY01nite_13720 [Chitinophaga cymbidii]
MKCLQALFRRSGAKKKQYANVDYGPYFERAVINGTLLECRFLGKLALPSGFVVACDPLLGLHDALPFAKRMPPGEYPVSIVLAGRRDRRRNALIRLAFSDKRAVHWELALVPGQRYTGTQQYYGFRAEAGIGCLCDAHSQKHYNRYLERFFREHPDSNIYDTLFEEAFGHRNNIDAEGCCFNFYLPSRPRLNVIMFNTGYGDGIYPAYWGVAKDGEVCSLVIDFMVL